MAQATAHRKRTRKSARPEPLLAVGALGVFLILIGL